MLTDRSVLAGDIGELCEWDWPDQDLLVITDGVRQGHHALALPFRDAVVEVDGGRVSEASCDAIVIDRESLDLGWLARALPDLVPSVRHRQNAPVVVVLDGCTLHPEPDVSAAALDGIRWDGLATLNGKLCAVLRTTEQPGENPGRLAELLAVAGTAAALTRDRTPAPVDAPLMRLLKDRRRSEHALLAQLESLIAQLDQQRRDHRGLRLLRTVLRRSRTGRAILRTLRPLRSAARAVRRDVRRTSTSTTDSR